MRFTFPLRCGAVILGLTPLAWNAQSTPAAGVKPAPKKAVATKPAADRPVIVAFGDSLTAGYGAEPGNSYPDFLQKDLDHADLGWRVVNAGVSGDTTTDGLNRLNEVLAAKPRVVIVEFGGNDGLRGLPIESTRANLEQIIVALRNAGIRVLLAGMTLPPNYGRAYIKSFEQVYAGLAEQYKLARIPFLLQDVVARPNFQTLIQRDGIHPTAQGNEIVATTVMRYLKPLLAR